MRFSALFPLILVSACNWGYGAPVDRAKFGSALLHEDGSRCVFALHDVVYRPAEGMRAFPDGGIPRYVTDRHKLGIVNIDTGKVTVLVDQKNRRWLNGHGSFHLAGLGGRWALIRQSGQRPDYDHDHLWLRLDLASGDLDDLPLDKELAVENRALGRVEVVDEDFTIILVTKKDDDPQEIWSRNPSGILRRLAVTDHYYGSAEGQIWWYDVTARAGARTDYKTGATIRERRANFAKPRDDPTSRCQARFDGSELIHQYEVGGNWQERPLSVRAPDLR
ncbi:MAG: hypothetical protein JRG94_03245 [Deltaproteobacteria bacterium]|nr:hypothetical protein [Deltaproteobacteria bacterium]MBW2726708.1 hypothetical protein [Deltaproteobacteria bacterium]